MQVYEREIEDFLCNNVDVFSECLGEEVFLIGRQIPITGGVADMLLLGEDTIYVVEIKRDIINSDAICQILRYIQGVKQYLNEVDYENTKVVGVLVAPEIDEKVQVALSALENMLCYIGIELGLKARRTSNVTFNMEHPQVKLELQEFMSSLQLAVEKSIEHLIITEVDENVNN